MITWPRRSAAHATLVLGVIASCGHPSSQPAGQRAAVARPASPPPAVIESAGAAATLEPSPADRATAHEVPSNADRRRDQPFVTRVYSYRVVSGGLEFTVGANGTYVSQDWTGVFVLGRKDDAKELPDTTFSVREDATSGVPCFLPKKTELPANYVRLIPPHP